MVSEQKAKELVIQNVYKCLDSLGYGKKISGACDVGYIVKGKVMTLCEYQDYCIRMELKKWGISI